MMIRAAGGPGLISPIDFGERRKPPSKATWIAIGVVGLAHVGAGAALYYQRFETPINNRTTAADPPVDIEMIRKPKPVEPVEAKDPPAPNTVFNKTPLPTQPTDTLTAVVPDTPSTATGPVITVSEIVPPEAPPGVGTEPIAPPRPPAVITNPQWLSRPSGDQLMRAYPDRALQAGIGGVASLECAVRVNGTLIGCSVLSETPAGQGFGRAATQLSRYFRISPRTVDGQAVEGSRVAVTIRFNTTD